MWKKLQEKQIFFHQYRDWLCHPTRQGNEEAIFHVFLVFNVIHSDCKGKEKERENDERGEFCEERAFFLSETYYLCQKLSV